MLEVVKLGGGVCRPEWVPALLDWLEACARAGPLLVVCGGGAHADTVRSEQQRLAYDDLTAHRQALLAMEQTAWWLHAAWRARHGRHCPVNTSAQAGTLWTPRDLLEDEAALPASWAITSDSLAAWLAGRQRAGVLTLLKAVDAGEQVGTAALWARQGWVDPAFPHYAEAAACRVRLLGQRAWATVGPSADKP